MNLIWDLFVIAVEQQLEQEHLHPEIVPYTTYV